jgi:arylsulfatase A
MAVLFSPFMKRFFTLLIFCGFMGSLALSAAEKPNIVIILADDMGYGDAQCDNPDAKTKTPNINELASDGVLFTDGHAGASVCSPSRYALMTGRYCWRTILKRGVLGQASPLLIEKNRDTLASLLKRNGYDTAAIGKWHLGLGGPGNLSEKFSTAPEGLTPGPNQVGFDYSFILTASMDMGPYAFLKNLVPVNGVDGSPSPPFSSWKTPKDEPHARGIGFDKTPIAPGFDPNYDANPTQYSRFNKAPPRFANEVVAYIDQRAQAKSANPFFLYYAIPSPHSPWVPDIDTTGMSPEQIYIAYVNQVDAEVGTTVAALKKDGFWNNSLVIFSSDNGAPLVHLFPKLAGYNPNGNLRGQKSDLYEGGHREPFAAEWPGHIAPGTVSDQLISFLDFYSTFASLVGDTKPDGITGGEDSVDFSDLFLGKKVDHPIRTDLVNHSGSGRFALREGDWEYLDWPGSGGYKSAINPPDSNSDGTPTQIFNLKDDLGEKVNLYSTQTARIAEMKARLTQIQGSDAPKAPLNGYPKHDDTND